MVNVGVVYKLVVSIMSLSPGYQDGWVVLIYPYPHSGDLWSPSELIPKYVYDMELVMLSNVVSNMFEMR